MIRQDRARYKLAHWEVVGPLNLLRWDLRVAHSGEQRLNSRLLLLATLQTTLAQPLLKQFPMPITKQEMERHAFHLGPGASKAQLSIYGIREGQTMEIRMESSNVLNHTNLNDPDSNIESNQFGRITTAGDPRIVQFGLKYRF